MGHPLDDALVAILAMVATTRDDNGVRMGALPGIEDALIFDGPALELPDQGRALALGVAGDEAATAFGNDTPSWGGRREVSYDLSCVAESWSGEVDMAPRRAQALALFEVVRAAIAADESLGGACTRAYVASWSYIAAQPPEGASAQIPFTVRVDATRFEGE